MLLRRELLAGLALLPLGACGFQPVYGNRADRQSASAALASVRVDRIPERPGQILRNALEDRFYANGGMADSFTHALRIALSERTVDLGIQKDDTATRAQLHLVARFELVDAATADPVLRGRSRSINSYNILDSQYGTLVTETDARERGLIEVADDITTRVALFFIQ